MGDSREDSFSEFFRLATGGFGPYEWQRLVALDGLPDILAVPTGLGKTEVALAWAWRLLVDKQKEPLHLVFCLPMRSLVSQTSQRLKNYFEAIKVSNPEIDVTVHQLMGGAIDDDWVVKPDKPWVLVGTQDQLLSRALNRGYSMNRFEWPIHFGLLNNDCRWLIDEVQLMGPGLWTTAQLDWMRRKRFLSLKPCLTTWMSATVDASFLSTTDRKRDALDEPTREQVVFESKLQNAFESDAELKWWREAKRPLEWWQPEASPARAREGRNRSTGKSGIETVSPEAIAASVKAKHVAGTLSLVICNTVEKAKEVSAALESVEHKVLLTSRFRREDRARYENRLIDFDAKRKAGQLPEDDPGLICVSTQVIEAGMDISAHCLFTELAPWPSMLQRLGRLNRKGNDQDAQAWVWEWPKEGGNKRADRVGPYDFADIELAKKLVNAFVPLSQSESFAAAKKQLEAAHQTLIENALKPKPSPLPRALDVHGLFSTERDVHGGFTDVSAFVRGTDLDVDVKVFWRDWSRTAPPRGDDLDGPLLEPAEEGCPVPCFGKHGIQEFLASSKAKAWLWDDEAERWDHVNHWDIRPGMLLMLKRDVGGYDENAGWTGQSSDTLAEVPRAGRGETLRDDRRTEVGYWSKLEDHLKDARREAEQLCDSLMLKGDIKKAVEEAAGHHDIGKAHPQWQAALPDRSAIPDTLLAKTPRVVSADVSGDPSALRVQFTQLRPKSYPLVDEARNRNRTEVVRLRWAIDDRLSDEELHLLRNFAGVLWAGHMQFRPGLRHEVASALAMWRKYFESVTKPYPALAVYLVAAHHGKARTVMRSTGSNGDDVFGVRREPNELIISNVPWPMDFSIAKDGADGYWEGDEFVLSGPGWTGLVADLLGPWRPEEMSEAGAVPRGEPRQLGPFALAYLEALVRIADWRASDPTRATAALKPSEVRNVY